MPVGSFDPDEEFIKKPGGVKPNTELQRIALGVCKRKYFHNVLERNEFRRLVEDKTIGATENQIMFKEWVNNCIDWARKKNEDYMPTITFVNLIRIVTNEEKGNEWITKNRQRILKERRAGLGFITPEKTGDNISRWLSEAEEDDGNNE